MTRRPRRLALILAAGLALSACTGGEEPVNPNRSSGQVPQVQPTVPPTSATPGPTSDGQTSPLGFHWDQSKGEKWAPYLATVPGTNTYFEFTWCEVQPAAGQWNWSRVDKAVTYANELDIEMLFKVRLGACWATDGEAQTVKGSSGLRTESRVPRDYEQYAEFIREVVRKYGAQGVRTFAIENEVNSAGYWAASTADYEKVIRTAAAAIREIDPEATVVDSGLSSTTYGYGIAQRLLDDGLEAEAIAAWNTYNERRMGTRGAKIIPARTVADLQVQLDLPQGKRNLEFLELVSRLSGEGIFDVRQFHFYERADAVPLLMDYLKATTDSEVALEGWEVGLFWRDGAGQAASESTSDEVVHSVTSLLAAGAERVLWLPLASNPNNKAGAEIRAGVINPDGSERIAGNAFRQLVDASRGAEATPIEVDGLAGAVFSSGDPEASGDKTIVVWSTAGTRTLRPDESVSLAVAGAASEQRASSLPVTSRPLVITTDLPASDVLTS